MTRKLRVLFLAAITAAFLATPAATATASTAT